MVQSFNVNVFCKISLETINHLSESNGIKKKNQFLNNLNLMLKYWKQYKKKKKTKKAKKTAAVQ